MAPFTSSPPQPHPLAPLTVAEFTTARDTVVGSHDAGTSLFFRSIYLEEPKKDELRPFLVAEHAGEVTDETRRPARLARVQYDVIRGDEPHVYTQSIVDVDAAKEISREAAEPGFQTSFTPAEFAAFQAACVASTMFQEAIAEFDIPDRFAVTIDPWPYGGPDADEAAAELPRYMQGLVFARDQSSGNPDSNHYAYPIPIIPVMDVRTKQLLRVDRLATGGPDDGLVAPPRGAVPRSLFRRNRAAEYVPELLDRPLRADLRPLDVLQPEGASFAVHADNLVEWQRWRFRVGFTPREGAVLHDLTYNGRPVLYRLSYSELTVPYGDPRPPFHRKQAFDLGDGGFGRAANGLALGCDCLGAVHYFDALAPEPDGRPAVAPAVVCLHEQDNGIGWKHTNFRTQRAVVTRLRELVVQCIVTLANYEYVFAYKLDVAGGLTVETRATGIVSVVALDDGDDDDAAAAAATESAGDAADNDYGKSEGENRGQDEGKGMHEADVHGKVVDASDVRGQATTPPSSMPSADADADAGPSTQAKPKAKAKPKTSPYGAVVAPGVLAQNHQHVFAVRIDPAIDSYADGDTVVVVEESHPAPVDAATNPHGNYYEVRRTPVARARWLDAEPRLNRVVRLEHRTRTNPVSGRPVGFKLAPPATQLLLADPDSTVARRAPFARHHVWVTGYRDGELWAAGEFTNQSRREKGGVQDMVARGDWFLEGEGEDGEQGDGDGHQGEPATGDGRKSHPVVWSVFGLTHNPRVEDWPVMPCEIHQLMIRPADFFTSNPALDVPGRKNETSVLVPCCNASRGGDGASSASGVRTDSTSLVQVEAGGPLQDPVAHLQGAPGDVAGGGGKGGSGIDAGTGMDTGIGGGSGKGTKKGDEGLSRRLSKVLKWRGGWYGKGSPSSSSSPKE